MKKVSGMPIGRVRALERRADCAAKEGRYFEAAMLTHAVVEYWLRIYLGYDKKLPAKFWDNGNLKFSSIIDYCELMGLNPKAITQLREFNDARNNLIHDIIHFEDFKPGPVFGPLVLPDITKPIVDDTVDQVAKKSFEIGQNFMKYFMEPDDETVLN